MTLLSFSKYSGCGNDFILIDNRRLIFQPQMVKGLCDRHQGVGADGVILLEDSSVADYRMVIYNADGSLAEMCGNGIRCLGKFIQELGETKVDLMIETHERLLSLRIEGEIVGVMMGSSEQTDWSLQLQIDADTYPVHFLNTGVPHVVYFTEDESFPVLEFGQKVRNHPSFSPAGTNVNVAILCGPNTVKVQTYERGVEGITLACGTGATATTLATAYVYGWKSPISVIVPSGDKLEISFNRNQNNFTDVCMMGPAKKVFSGLLADNWITCYPECLSRG